MIKQTIYSAILALAAASPAFAAEPAQSHYVPTAENLAAREQFADHGFGVFIHWGLYSMFAQGEWYLNKGISADEYAKSAAAFYPANFDARAWAKAIKEAGANYVCFTTRHHDGFSMFGTKQSPYNIVDATPFGRDVLKELADACAAEGLKLHLYYSHIDWTRPDYPSGRTGLSTGRDPKLRDWPSYYKFMNAQLTELLTNYGPIGAIWFDGLWDHDEDKTPFDWQLGPQYEMIHRLQPQCLVANNHHQVPFEGEDIQIFERDLPGQNEHGLSGQDISQLHLETCQTMNGMWGYKIADQEYKDAKTLIHYLVGAAGRGANLLLNVGPQPDGSIPATALERFKEMGQWLKENGRTIYATRAGDVAPQAWGATTRSGDKLYVHVLDNEPAEIYLPLTAKIKKATAFADGSKIKTTKTPDGWVLTLPARNTDTIDYIVECQL
ncbi:MAG: alpha-L-fucosidase [Muribaculaceae bacterium]|nr:alpha-L-fucosidase [Muribaculaceae bacterium]MDE6118573.1 alpha-L-fucosidase [Muribaculaceae bacterium]